MLRDGVEVAAKFGVRPFLEADMLVEVGSSRSPRRERRWRCSRRGA
jgi:hypothetical protein